MKIVIFGAGAVGGYLGSRLAVAKHEVTFVARGAHLDAIRRRGLIVQSPLGNLHLFDARAVGSITEVDDAEFVILAVKLWDTEGAAKQLQSIVRRGATVISFQNGVEKDGILRGFFPSRSIMGGVCYIASVISNPGVIAHNGRMQRFVFGEFGASTSDRAQRFYSACSNAGIEAEVSSNIERDIWEKFIWLVGLSGATSTVRQSLGSILIDPHARAFLLALMQEAAALARVRGINIPENFAMERLAFCKSLPPTLTSSMHHDLQRGNRLELAWLSGYVADAAAKSGIFAPMNSAARSILSIYAGGASAN